MTDDTAERAPLGMRMKRYEAASRHTLPRRTYTLMRLDGRSFGTYLENSEKPFDLGFIRDMDAVTKALCREITGVRFAYTQSDEISLLLTDFQSTHTEPWFDGRVEKMVSVSASRAGIVMDRLRRQDEFPDFDCRVWSVSDPVEVANYFLWRQWDAVNNSIQMLAQHYYEPEELFGLSTDAIQDRLWKAHDVNWSKLPAGIKRGRIATRTADEGWQLSDAPHFVAASDNWLATAIPPLPSLWS